MLMDLEEEVTDVLEAVRDIRLILLLIPSEIAVVMLQTK